MNLRKKLFLLPQPTKFLPCVIADFHVSEQLIKFLILPSVECHSKATF